MFFDKEIQILGRLFEEDPDDILLLPKTPKIEKINENLFESYSAWIDSAGKGDPTPDFYNDKSKIMLEVFRVTDNPFKRYNPTKAAARKIEKEIITNGFLPVKLIENTLKDLNDPSRHDFLAYKYEFKRILEKHIAQIPTYKTNHPGYKMGFLIFDETPSYIERSKTSMKTHIYYKDPYFLDLLANNEFDFVIWYAPYKSILDNEYTKGLPTVCIIDTTQIKKYISVKNEYDENQMIVANRIRAAG